MRESPRGPSSDYAWDCASVTWLGRRVPAWVPETAPLKARWSGSVKREEKERGEGGEEMNTQARQFVVVLL